MARIIQPEAGGQTIPLKDVSDFIRQLAHDLHNDLNALDLAATYVGEIVEDSSAREELETQRKTLQSMSKVLHALSLHLQPPHPETLPLAASDVVGGFRERLSQTHAESAAALAWTCEVGTIEVDVDFAMVCTALTEVFNNALIHGSKGDGIAFCARVEGGMLRLAFSNKTPAAPESIALLGCEPFIAVKRRNYGLGLFYAARVARAHGGGLEARYDAGGGLFEVEMALPVMPEESTRP